MGSYGKGVIADVISARPQVKSSWLNAMMDVLMKAEDAGTQGEGGNVRTEGNIGVTYP